MQVSEQRRQAYLLFSFRGLWVVVALGTLLLVILSIKLRYQQLSSVTPNPVIPNGQLLPLEIQALAEIGVSIQFYAGWITFLEGLTAIEFLLLGMAVFLIRSKEWMPLIFALGMVGLGAYTSPLTSPLDDLTPTLTAVTLSMRAIMFSSLIVAFLLFPNGRFIPSWTIGLALVWTAFNLASLIYQPFQMKSSMVWVEFTQVLLLLWAFFWLILIAVLQVYRYRRYSSPVERQQTKWVVYGLAVSVLVMMAAGIPFILLQILSTDPVTLIIARLVVVTVTLLALSFMGASFAVAILRYRLWDIDLIIRRTAVYGALTLTLLLIYFTSVVLFQQIALQVSGGSSPLAVIFSTLVIAALFNPLRRRIQNDIDRHFYRRKYDAVLTLANFAATARLEVDQEHLAKRLVEVVDDAMQPEHVSIWLKE
jgi:hypothetical protein